MKRFTDHVDKCDSCREELVIQILIHEGMVHLEDGDAFDLQKELRERMNEAKKKIRIHEKILRIGTVFEIMTMAGILGIVAWILI